MSAGDEKRATSDSNVKVFFRSEVPAKTAIAECPPKLSFADLKFAAWKALAIDASMLAKCTYSIAAYLTDIKDLGAKGEKEEVTLTKGCTVFIWAPVELRVSASSEAKAGAGAGDAKASASKKDEEEVDDPSQPFEKRYAGFSAGNALSKLAAAASGSSALRTKIAFEFVDVVAGEVFEQKEWLELKAEHVERIIGSDTLNATEAQVVDAVLRWGRAQVSAQKLDEKDPANLRKVLAKLIPLVRWPLLETSALAAKVVSAGVLEPPQVLAMFTYSASADKTIVPDDLKVFNFKPRFPRLAPGGGWSFDTSPVSQWVTGSSNNRSVSYTTVRSQYDPHLPVLCSKWLTSGSHTVRFRVDASTNPSYPVQVGVISGSFRGMNAEYVDYGGDEEAAAPASGQTVQPQGSIWQRCTSGMVVEMRIDMDKRTVTFLNGSSGQQLAVHNSGVKKTVCPAVQLTNSGDRVTLL